MVDPAGQRDVASEKAAYLANRLNVDYGDGSQSSEADKLSAALDETNLDGSRPQVSNSNPQVNNPSAVFTLFEKLPTELRSHIWKLDFLRLPTRIISMKIGSEIFEFMDDLPPVPPALLACREARTEGFKHGALIQRYRLDRGPADDNEQHGPWPQTGRPQPLQSTRRRLLPRATPCPDQFFYTNFEIDQYILTVDDFPKAYPTFRIMRDFYRPDDVPTGLDDAPLGYRRLFPAFDDAIIPPIFSRIRRLVLEVSLERTNLLPNDPQFAQWIIRATRGFIQTYVRTTLVNFPLLESIGFLIERQNRTTPSSLGYPFDGDQELREMDEVAIQPESRFSTGRETLKRLEIGFRNEIWRNQAIRCGPQNLKFMFKMPKSLPRTRYL